MRRRREDRGQATVELALVLPVLMLALIAVLQVALVVRDHVALVHATREAARAASVDPDAGAAVRAAHRTLPGASVHVGPRPGIGEPIVVDVTYTSKTNLPLVGTIFPDPELHARVTMRVEK